MTKIAKPAIKRVKLGDFLRGALGSDINAPSTLMVKERETGMGEAGTSVEGLGGLRKFEFLDDDGESRRRGMGRLVDYA